MQHIILQNKIYAKNYTYGTEIQKTIIKNPQKSLSDLSTLKITNYLELIDWSLPAAWWF